MIAWAGLNPPCRAAETPEDSQQEAKLAKLPEGKSILPADNLKTFSIKHGQDVLRMEIVPVESMPFREALRIEKLKSADDAEEEQGQEMDAVPARVDKLKGLVQIESRSVIPLRSGDWVLLTFYARTIRASDEKRGARLGAHFGFSIPPWSGSLSRETALSPQWKKYYYSFPLVIKNKLKKSGDKNLAAAGEQRVLFNLAFPPQTIELADIRCVSYGPKVIYRDLPQMPVTYAGREPDAAWRRAAEERIEKLRKGDLTVAVTRDGKPVADAKVEVRMVRHAFGFGTASSSFRILKDKSPDGERYRQELLRLFNGCTPESGLTMRSWWHNPDAQKAAIEEINWLREHGMEVHGHPLVWPSWRKNPPDMKSMEKNPALLRKTIDAHIRDIVTATKGAVSMWLVVNESWASFDWIDLLGEESLAEWFRAARKADPDVKLFINENRILGAGDANTNSVKHRYLEQIVKRLLAGGAPIQGIGLQSHSSWESFMSPENMLKVLDRLAAVGNLEIAVTEFGFYVSDEDLQGDFVRDYYLTLFSHPNVTSIYMWGFWDGQHHAYNAPIFRKNWTLKPAGKAYQDLVLGKWWTNADGATDAGGRFRTRGFLGQYEIVVRSGNRTRTVRASLPKDGATVAVELTAPDEPPPAGPKPLVYMPPSEKPPVGEVSTASGVARVDLKAAGVELRPGEVTGGGQIVPATWVADAELRKAFLTWQGEVRNDAWTTVTVRFTPAADGELDLKLKGEYDKKNNVWVYYDKVQAVGAEIANGDFEEKRKDNKPLEWALPTAKGAEYVRDGKMAASGGACVKVCFDAYAMQKVKVKKDQEVALTFSVKFAAVSGK